jgi:hypothetical protein
MSKPDKEGTLSFIQRCLTDAQTGKVMLSKRDQEFLRKAFKAIGRDVRRPFKDEGDLLHAFFKTLDKMDFLLFYEQLRLVAPDHDDPLDDLSAWTDLSQIAYLAIRIIAKLNLLRADSDDLPTWIRDQFGGGYVNQDGRIAFEDEERMIELDKVLEERVRTTLWPGNAGTT